jgi:hypothetical protein
MVIRLSRAHCSNFFSARLSLAVLQDRKDWVRWSLKCEQKLRFEHPSWQGIETKKSQIHRIIFSEKRGSGLTITEARSEAELRGFFQAVPKEVVKITDRHFGAVSLQRHKIYPVDGAGLTQPGCHALHK